MKAFRPTCVVCHDKPARRLPLGYLHTARFCSFRCAAEYAQDIASILVWCPLNKCWENEIEADHCGGADAHID